MIAVLNNPTIPTTARMMFVSDQSIIETADLLE
jgi:hypothetical protein